MLQLAKIACSRSFVLDPTPPHSTDDLTTLL